MKALVRTAIFLISIGSALLLLSPNVPTASAQSASSFFTQTTSGGTAASTSTASGLFSSTPSGGFFTLVNSNFTPVSTSTASANINGGIMTCSGAVCVNLAPTCSLSLIFTRDVRSGDTGIDVVALQKYLENAKFMIIPEGTTYGYFGPKTIAGLSIYQAASGLPISGFLDAATRSSLNERVFGRTVCLPYARYDQLQFTLAAKANRTTVASDLNSVGIKAEGGKTFCSLATSTSNTCFNIAKINSFVGYLPSKVSAVKSALYLAGFTNRFSKVDYVPSDPAFALGSVVTISKTTTFTTTTTITTVSPTFGTSTASSTSATTTTTFGR